MNIETLKPFCADITDPRGLHHPFIAHNYVCATDGFLLILINADQFSDNDRPAIDSEINFSTLAFHPLALFNGNPKPCTLKYNPTPLPKFGYCNEQVFDCIEINKLITHFGSDDWMLYPPQPLISPALVLQKNAIKAVLMPVLYPDIATISGGLFDFIEQVEVAA